MGLSSFLSRKTGAPPAGEPADEVQQARTRARRRLIGAVVLLGIGIVGFPLVFETQPRPIPVDIPIEIPHKEGAAPLALPPPAVVANAPVRPASQPARSPADDMITEPREAEPSRPAAVETRPAAPKPAPESPSVAARPVAPPAKVAVQDGARARALLEGSAPPSAASAAGAARYVVQVGAFADPAAAQDTRQKMEKLGLKTYTQVASTAAGGRTRVRVGPFPTREEADRALARARGAGLSGVVIGL